MADIVARTNPTRGSVLDAVVETRHTQSIDESGWLLIQLEGGGRVTIPEYVQVVLMEKRDRDGKPVPENEERQFFIVREGLYKGKTASLKKENAAKCLIKTTRGTGAVLRAVTIGRKWERSAIRDEYLDQLWATLHFDGKTARITLDSHVPMSLPGIKPVVYSNPLPKGTYKIKTPEAAHDHRMTDYYSDASMGGYPGLRYYTVWFQLENPATQDSNFVHVGHLSEGCVTIYQLEMWNPLYKYLISNRSDKEAHYVGTITIE
jgi:hypothetical protein